MENVSEYMKDALNEAEESDRIRESSNFIYVQDAGLKVDAQDLERMGPRGRIIRMTEDGRSATTIADDLKWPDGIDFSLSAGRIFWTNMGINPSKCDGSIMSANFDGSDINVVIPEGGVHTPKQLVIEEKSKKLWFCDREGMGVHRCDFDGQNHEILVQRGDWTTSDQEDKTRHCVGITVDAKAGKFYWTQKGPAKGGIGRIFRANIEMPAGQNAWNRTDIKTLFSNLPEPIDLQIDVPSQTLYWTDRGKQPEGCTLNRAYVGPQMHEGELLEPTILATNFDEPIGLVINPSKSHIYVTDLSGRVYRLNLDGTGKKVIHFEERATYTGIAIVPSTQNINNQHGGK